jgi:transposase
MAAQGIEIARLDHLGIVAGLCREIGIAEYLDARDTRTHERVSVGTATVAMLLNGLGFANRRLYLVSQFFKTKPVAHLLGPGITAEDLNDDCLGRTLDWLYAHDPTALFAGIAAQARQRFGLSVHELHVDTTSFSVSGDYARAENGELDAQAIAITSGYSRDRRQDRTQWMLALATSGEGAIPVFLRPLNGNASDQRALVQTIEALVRHLQEAGEERARPLGGGWGRLQCSQYAALCRHRRALDQPRPGALPRGQHAAQRRAGVLGAACRGTDPVVQPPG